MSDLGYMSDGDIEYYGTFNEEDDDEIHRKGKSSGIMWNGVNGMDSICVVTKTGVLEQEQHVACVDSSLQYDTKETVLCNFRKTAISELEDTSRKLGKSFGQSFKKPFSVVSVIPYDDKVLKECGHEASVDQFEIDEIAEDSFKKLLLKELKNAEASSVEYDEKKAIELLKEKMSFDNTFNVDETIQTAISAFQHLLQKKFKANEIEVSVTDPYYWISPKEAKYKDATIKELEMSDIENHLAVINEPVIAAITMPNGDMDVSETIRDGDMDGSKTINYKDMDPSLTAELRRNGKKCRAEFFQHDYIYNCSNFVKMKMDTFTVDETTQGFATAIIGICDHEARFGVLAVDSYVCVPTGDDAHHKVKVVKPKSNKLVNVFGSVFLTATGYHYLISSV